MAKSTKPPARTLPNETVILALDQAMHTGWSIWCRGDLVSWGELDVNVIDTEAVRLVVVEALEMAAAMGLPCTLVLEHAWGGNVATLQGMGAAKAVWTAMWDHCGGVKSRKVQVWPSHWRSRVLPRGYASAKREVVREQEQKSARALVGDDCGPLGDDEAPAILIGKWASHAQDVWDKLPKGFRKAAA